MPLHRHRVSVLLVVLGCVLAVAACGSSSNTEPNNAASGFSQQALTFSRCMRADGVPNFPDPRTTAQGVGFHIGPNSGINPQSPAFRSAQRSCKHLLRGGGPSSGPVSAQVMAQTLRISECMRSHGVPGFPDPTTTPPSGSASNGLVIDRSGAVLAMPSSIDPQSPTFQKAAAACNLGL
jgi:hypothetical protein